MSHKYPESALLVRFATGCPFQGWREIGSGNLRKYVLRESNSRNEARRVSRPQEVARKWTAKPAMFLVCSIVVHAPLRRESAEKGAYCLGVNETLYQLS
jgi:hypothetical protein